MNKYYLEISFLLEVFFFLISGICAIIFTSTFHWSRYNNVGRLCLIFYNFRTTFLFFLLLALASFKTQLYGDRYRRRYADYFSAKKSSASN